MKFDWNRARAFLVTAEEGSLSAAARALGTTQPTLGRQVAALEEELGLTLFERTARGLVLTESGLELVEHVREMGTAASRVSLAASGQSQSVAGLVRISASEVGSAFTLPAIIEDMRRAHPGIEVELVATNAISDLRRREADIALRSVRPSDPGLIATKLGGDTGALYAAHSYLRRAGDLSSAEALSRASFVGLEDRSSLIGALNAFGLELTAENFPVQSANHLVHWELVKAGAGIGVMVSGVGDSEPRVARAAPWMPDFEFDLWLVAHRELATSRRVRIVFDWLDAALRKQLRR